MKRRICVFIVIIMICGLFSGCEAVKKVSVENPVSVTGVQEEGIKEYPKALRLALSDAKSLYPYDEQHPVNLQVLKLLYEPLFTYDENMRVIPWLAESYSISEDGRKITVRIKDGIKWHDGKTLTANDVIYTINVLLASETVYSEGVIQRASVVDRRTVQVSFFKPMIDCAEKLMFPIVKSKNDSVIGTGPFKFTGEESADTYGFKRFEEYHGDKPAIESLKVINCPDEDAVVKLFDIGETDVLTSQAFDYSTFNAGSNTSVYDYPTNKFVYIGINFENSIFWGQSTRQALMYVLDKNEIVDKTMYKKAQKADFPINPSSWLYAKELEYKKDNARAEELLLSESWTRVDGVFARMLDGNRQNFKIDILVSDDEELKNIASVVEKNFDNFGLDCGVTVKPQEQFLQDIQNKSYDLFIDRMTLSGCSDFESLTGEGNIFGYLNSDLNMLTDKIRTESNEGTLRTLYSGCAEIFLKDVQFIPLFFYKDAIAVNGNVSQNVIPGLNNPFYNIREWNR